MGLDIIMGLDLPSKNIFLIQLCSVDGLDQNLNIAGTEFVNKALSIILFTKDISIKRNVTEMLLSL